MQCRQLASMFADPDDPDDETVKLAMKKFKIDEKATILRRIKRGVAARSFKGKKMRWGRVSGRPAHRKVGA
jgi:hypothetical protein